MKHYELLYVHIFNLDSSRIIFSLFPPRLLYARPDSSQTLYVSLLFLSLCCFETLHIFEPSVQVQHRRNENISVLRRRDSASEAWICHASVPFSPLSPLPCDARTARTIQAEQSLLTRIRTTFRTPSTKQTRLSGSSSTCTLRCYALWCCNFSKYIDLSSIYRVIPIPYRQN